MAKTPEGKVKAAVDQVLEYFRVMYDKPVITGFGKRQLDYVCCYFGKYITIETKAKNGVLTGQQREKCKDAYLAGGKVFIISSAEGCMSLVNYLTKVARANFFNPAATDRVPPIGALPPQARKPFPRVPARQGGKYRRTTRAR